MMALKEYLEDGCSPFSEWFNSLDVRTAARIDRYVRRMEAGNFGDSKSVGKGVSELKVDFGPGYRVYYGRDGDTLVILLGGGSKRKQQSDIAKAIARWAAYKSEKKKQSGTKNKGK